MVDVKFNISKKRAKQPFLPLMLLRARPRHVNHSSTLLLYQT
jgi:hypothetical protein